MSLCLATTLMIGFFGDSARSQDNRRPSISARVLDEQGAAIAGARVVLTSASGSTRSVLSDQEGVAAFRDLPVGNYTLQISAENFRPYEMRNLTAEPGRDTTLNATLRIAVREERITVLSENPLIKDAEYIGGSFILRGDVLRALEGTGGVEAMLRALAVRSAGPFGPQALINGFEDTHIPPTYAIREIRINDNPFSAEYPSLALGRIEILTKPGTERLRMDAFGSFGDATMNSRNPYANDKARYQSRIYGGYISGPIWRSRSTFFADFNRQEVDMNAVINATVVDAAGKVMPFTESVVTPEKRTSFAPRMDFQLNDRHTLITRYADIRTRNSNSGVGELSLISRAQNGNSRTQTFQVTETAVVSPSTINETRLQYVRYRSSRFGDNSNPTIRVPGAFLGGGAEVGVASHTDKKWDLTNVTSWQSGKHLLKAGLQVKHNSQTDGSTQNFGGTYTFGSRIAPQLNSRDEVVLGIDGRPIRVPISTIEVYRRTVLFRRNGFSPQTIRDLGGGASQFSLTAGEVETQLRQYHVGAFIQDEWRVLPQFTVSAGVRYERQKEVAGYPDVAPRVAFAWGLDGGSAQPRTVLRGGVGLFFERVPEHLILRARQMNGAHQRQFFVTENSILDLFPAVPSPGVLAGFAVPQSRVQLAGDIRAPYTLNSSISVERQVVDDFTLAATVARLRGVHLLRSRNINAPLPGAVSAPLGIARPLGTAADVLQYESSGVFEQRQFLLNAVYRAGREMTLWSTYTLSSSKSDTDHPDTFPSSSYDLLSEYGRSASDARHTLYFGGWFRTFAQIEVTPLILWRTGVPFDITTGRDTNGDSLFTDRPAFASDPNKASVIVTPYGAFDLSPESGQETIPRNFGQSPKFFITNLRLARRFPLTDRVAMTVAMQGQNIFNRTNPGLPVGTLGSPFFGRSVSSAGDWGFGSNQAGNRRLEFMMFWSF